MELITKMNKDHSNFSYLFGWFSLIFGSLTLSDWALIVGMLATIMGLMINWYYKHLEYKLNKQKTEKKNGSKPQE